MPEEAVSAQASATDDSAEPVQSDLGSCELAQASGGIDSGLGVPSASTASGQTHDQQAVDSDVVAFFPPVAAAFNPILAAVGLAAGAAVAGGGGGSNPGPGLRVTQTNTNIAGDGVINAAERTAGVVLSGTTEVGRTVTIATGTGTVVSVTADAITGSWGATVPAANLPESGDVTFTVTSSDAAGNTATVTRTVRIDTAPPAAPGVDTLAGDDIVNAGEQGSVISGTNEAGATVALSIGGQTRAATVNGTSWSYTLTAADITAMEEGGEAISVTQTDAAGNTSAAATRDITVDTVAPAAASIVVAGAANGLNASEATNAVAVTVTPAADASIVSAMIGEVALTAVQGEAGKYTFDATGLAQGEHTLTVVTRDAAGNETTSTEKFTIDTAAPTLAITAPSAALSTTAGTAGDSEGETITLTLTFDGPVNGLTSGTNNTVFTVGGTAVSATWGGAAGGITRTLTYTVQAGQNGQAAIDEAALKTALVAGITDAAGNAFDYTGDIANIDSAALPVVDTALAVLSTVALSATRDGSPVTTGNLKAGDVVTLTATYDGEVLGNPNSAPTLTIGTETGIALTPVTTTGNTRSWIYTISGATITDTGAISVAGDLAAGLGDAAGNAVTGAPTATGNLTADTTAPSVTIASNDSDLRVGEKATLTLTFSEAVEGFEATDLSVESGTLGPLSDAMVNADGSVSYTIEYNPNPDVDDPTMAVTLANTWTDRAGNDGPQATLNLAVDTVLSKMSRDDLSRLNDEQARAITSTQLNALTSDQLRALSSTAISGLSSSAIGGMSSDQIVTLSTSQVAAFTSSQVTAFTSNQVAALTSSQVAALTSSQVAALTSNQVDALDSSQITALGDNLANLGSSALASIDSTQAAGITGIQLARFDTAGIQALSSEAIGGLGGAAFGALGSDQLGALTSTQVGAITSTQVGILRSDQITALGNDLSSLGSAAMNALSSDQTAAITSAQINSFDSADIRALSASALGNLNSGALAALSSSQAAGITSEQIGGLDTVDIQALGTGAIRGLGSGTVGALNGAQLDALTSSQVGAITSAQVRALQPGQITALGNDLSNLGSVAMNALSSQQTAAITPTQFQSFERIDMRALSTEGVRGMSTDVMVSLTIDQIMGLFPDEIQGLTTQQISVLSAGLIGAIRTDSLASLRPEMINALSPSQVSGLTFSRITALSAQQFAAFKPETLASLPATFGGADLFRSDHLAALNGAQLEALTSAQLALITSAAVAGLNSSRIAALGNDLSALNANAMASLGSAQAAGISPGQIASFDSADIRALTSAALGNLSSDVLAALTSVQATGITSGQLAGLDTADIRALTPAALGNLSTNAMASLSSAQAAGITSSQIASFDSADIRALTSAALGNLSSDVLAALTSVQATGITSGQLAGLDTADIQALSPAALGNLSTNAMASLSSAQAAGITAGQIASFDSADIRALTSAALGNLSSDVLAALTSVQATGITSGQLAGLDTADIQALSTAAIRGLSSAVFGTLSSVQLDALGSAQIGAITSAQIDALSGAQITALGNDLSGLSAGAIASIDSVQAAGITAAQIDGLSLVQIGALSLGALDNLNASAAASLDAMQTAAVLTRRSVERRFVLGGEGASDWAGWSVSGVGDFNGDGLDDVIVGAYQADPAAGANAGRSYVVFGRSDPQAIDLSAVAAGSGGFVIHGQCASDQSGYSVSGAGDVNGDGLTDLIVGARFHSTNGTNIGRSYVVFGRSGSPLAIDLSALAGGMGGFVINGQAPQNQSGHSVSGAGDVNGDGLADLIVGAPWNDPSAGTDAGRSYVVFGKANTTAVNLTAIAGGTGGFVINGQASGDNNGWSVAAAGDVNGDGLADLIVGAPFSDPSAGANAGRSYVVFGQTGTAGIDLSAVAGGTGGFVINGQASGDNNGWSVAAAGDVNGDGLADLIVGASSSDPAGRANAGRAYVVFGQSGTTAIDLSAVAAGSGGFAIQGEGASFFTGTSVAAAGDLNGDGLADVIVSAFNAGGTGNPGRAYVVYGQSGTTTIEVSAVAAGSGGFVITGVSGDLLGNGNASVAAAGDLNGDGFADLIVGASRADVGGRVDAGAAYVIYGGPQFLSGAYALGTGTNASELVLGTAGNDTLTGGGGVDRFSAGAGNDTLVLTGTDVSHLASNTPASVKAWIDGGTGIDTLRLTGGASLDLTAIANVGGMTGGTGEKLSKLNSIERIDLGTDTAANTLKLSLTDVLDMAGMNLFNTGNGWSNVDAGAFDLGSTVQRHQLVVDGATGDVVNVAGGANWTNDGQVSSSISGALQTYNVWNHSSGAAQMLIDSDIARNNVL